MQSAIIPYDFEEIQAATDNFSEAFMIGHGWFGDVFQASIRQTPVAIKRLDEVRTKDRRDSCRSRRVLEFRSKIRYDGFSSLSNSCQSPYQFCSARMFLHQ